jgi:SP family sugar:H+ symporter-like MFS transporter
MPPFNSLITPGRVNADSRLCVVNGVLGVKEFGKTFGSEVSPDHFELSTTHKSLITSILSAGYFCDRFGKKTTILAGSTIYPIGVVFQIAANSVGLLVVGLLVAGRAVAGFGVGIVNSAVVLYTGKLTAKRVRGKVLCGYQFAITIGLLLSAAVNEGTKDIESCAAYRIPIGI